MYLLIVFYAKVNLMTSEFDCTCNISLLYCYIPYGIIKSRREYGTFVNCRQLFSLVIYYSISLW